MATRSIMALPRDDATNGWANILPARTPTTPLEGAVVADWVVVDAGFAGLAAWQGGSESTRRYLKRREEGFV